MDPNIDGSKVDNTISNYILGAAIVLLILGIAFLFAIMCFKNSLKIAIDIIDASADFLNDTKKIVGVPVVVFNV